MASFPGSHRKVEYRSRDLLPHVYRTTVRFAWQDSTFACSTSSATDATVLLVFRGNTIGDCVRYTPETADTGAAAVPAFVTTFANWYGAAYVRGSKISVSVVNRSNDTTDSTIGWIQPTVDSTCSKITTWRQLNILTGLKKKWLAALSNDGNRGITKWSHSATTAHVTGIPQPSMDSNFYCQFVYDFDTNEYTITDPNIDWYWVVGFTKAVTTDTTIRTIALNITIDYDVYFMERRSDFAFTTFINQWNLTAAPDAAPDTTADEGNAVQDFPTP